MRPLILLAGFIFLSCQGHAQEQGQNNFTINGTVLGRDTGIICLYYRNANGKSIKDTARLVNGRFSFSGKINEPTDAAIAGNIGRLELNNPNIVEVFIEPFTMNVKLKNDHFKEIQMEGSTTQKESGYVDSLKGTWLRDFSRINRKLNSLSKTKGGGRNNEELKSIKVLKDSLTFIRKRIKQIDLNFIDGHPKSYLSLSTIQDYFSSHDLSVDSANRLYAGLDQSLKTTKLAGKLANEIKARLDNKPGINAADFTKQDFTNKEIKLSSFRNKNVVLIEFWATWCEPCLKIKPEIKSILDKYQPLGLVLIQVSIDAHKEKWQNYLNGHDESRYINLWDPPGSADDLRPMYDVVEIPALVLINKNGNIINHYLGDSSTLGLSDLKSDLVKLF